MAIELEQVSIDDARRQPLRTDIPALPAVHGWSKFLTRSLRAPLAVWAVLLLVAVIYIAGEASTRAEWAARSEAASSMPLLMMMTEKPVRRVAP